MTQNTLGDLNNHLFMQLERLGDESLSREELQSEIKRANAVASVAQQVVSNNRLNLDAKKPRMLEG